VATTSTTVLADFSGALGSPVVSSRSTVGPAGVTADLAVADVVDQAVADYEKSAVAGALSGRSIDVSSVLTTEAARSLNPNERAVLTDEATVRASSLKDVTNSVVLTGYSGSDGAVDVVDATLDLKVTGTTSAGASFTITRTGHLTLIDQSGWRIDSFDLSVERDLP
jgi:hypothetical protein